MEHATETQPVRVTTRRVFLKQVVALTSATAAAAFLSACGSSGSTSTAPTVAQSPTTLPTTAPTLVGRSLWRDRQPLESALPLASAVIVTALGIGITLSGLATFLG